MKKKFCFRYRSTLCLFAFLLLFLLCFSTDIIEGCSELSALNCPSTRKDSNQGWISSSNKSCSNDCERWMISGHEGDVITLSFEYFDIPARNKTNCLDGYLLIGFDNNCQRFCGVDRPLSYKSTTETLHILYNRSNDIFGLGFQLRYSIGSIPSKEPCTAVEFKCHNGKCIPKTWQCNGMFECEDDSDEICQHYSDETITTTVATPVDYSCGFGSFCCIDSIYERYHCFSDYNRCNHISDCADGRDEKDCECHKILSGHDGSFTQPVRLLNDLSCSFLITIPNGTIQLRFIAFNFTNNHKDFIEIFNGGVADNNRLIGRYNGHQRPPKIIESIGSQVYIKYNRSSSSSYPLFNCTYQQKGFCLPGQFRCKNEDDCYDVFSVCDYVWDCKQYGSDELKCGDCSGNSYRCRSGSACYLINSRCNGIADCNDYVDEMQCMPEQCGHQNGTYLCQSDSHQCILENLVCNGFYDCKDNSDEISCPLPNKIIIAAVIGSLCCSLLLVIAIGCVCRLQATRMLMHSRSHHVSPITAIQEELLARLSAPPLYDEAMVTSRPYEEVRAEMLRNMQLVVREEDEMNLLPSSDGETRPMTSDNSVDAQILSCSGFDDDDDDELIIDVGTRNHGFSGSDSELDCSAFDESLVDLSLMTGCHAQWRRNQSSDNHLSSATTTDDIHDMTQLNSSNNDNAAIDDKQIDSASDSDAISKNST